MKLIPEDPDIKMLIALIVVVVIGGIFFYSSSSHAQFREQEAWRFRTPFERSVAMQAMQAQLLHEGGYFDGEHTARYYNVDMDVQHMDAEGFQEITNIGNLTTTTTNIEGSGNTINVDGSQDSARQQGQNGMASRDSSTDQMLNVGAVE